MIPTRRLGTAAHLAAGLGVLGAAGYAFVAVVGHVFHDPADAGALSALISLYMLVNIIGPGEYFGEITLDGGPRSASVQALDDCRCAVAKRSELLALVEKEPRFALHMVRKLASRVRDLTENVRSLALLDVYGRVARLLLDLAESRDGRLVIDEPLTHRDIATRVGASREMISRIFSDLSAGGYVAKEDGKLVIVRKPPPRW